MQSIPRIIPNPSCFEEQLSKWTVERPGAQIELSGEEVATKGQVATYRRVVVEHLEGKGGVEAEPSQSASILLSLQLGKYSHM